MNCLKIGSKLQNGKYEIVKVLGQGGFGITYLAVHTFLDKKVAIKEFFPKNFCDRDETTNHITLGTANTAEVVSKLKIKFLKEAKNIAKLNHPNIVSIQDIFEENNTAYYLMDYIEGKSLADIIKENGAMSENLAIRYIQCVSSAISYMHDRSMNHLDIKPANIMIRSTDDMPILIDFGTSKQYDSEGEQTSTMAPGFTHGYAPVEQYKPGGVSIFTPQTDIYALGATLYALLTGKKPPHYSEILEDGLPELPLTISPSTKKGIEHAMEIRKNKRPANIDEFLSHFAVGQEIKNEGFILNQLNHFNDNANEGLDEDIEETVYAQVVSSPSIQPQKNKINEARYTRHAISVSKTILDCDFVDLGLSVLWATHNIGASKPHENGIYFDKLSLSPHGLGAELDEWQNRGAKVPTLAQFEELRNRCKWVWMEFDGVTGYEVIGTTGNSIFIPSNVKDNIHIVPYGRLFTNEALFGNQQSQYYFYFHFGDYKLTKYSCNHNCPIRLIAQK